MKRIATTLLVAGLMATPMLALPPAAQAAVSVGIGISVGIPPPALPVYAQPIIPGPGYVWTPGYWAWDPGYGGYYWVPGTWVLPPQIGLLWTPGWWGWSGGFYRWNAGYWGLHVGFYGGVNYGYGYFGSGYSGGYWRGRDFYYNRAVNNVNVTNIHNVYVNKTVINNVNVNRVSYNGGRDGIVAQPSAQQQAWANQRRIQPTTMQTQQRDMAMRNPAQRFKTNQGQPAVFATQRPGNFSDPHAVRAPSPSNSRMVASEHARPVTAPNRGMVQAPRDHQQAARPADQSSRQERTAQPREHEVVQAPHNRPQPTWPADQSFRQESTAQQRDRPQPVQPAEQPLREDRPSPQRVEYRQPGSRPAPVARSEPPGRGSERGKGRPDDRKRDNGPGH